MKNKMALFSKIVFVFFCISTNIQAQSLGNSFNNNVKRVTIKPSKTDDKIKAFDLPHLILYDQSIKQGKLFLFLPGTNGVAENGPSELFKTAIEQGYRVICLSYINNPAVSNICIRENLQKDCDCAEKFRIKRIYGENVSTLITDEPQDAIINRFTKLLLYLVQNDKAGNWDYYLENGNPRWNKIVISGQSQGGGMSAFIAKKVLVDKIITFSGGWDYSANNEIAKWYYKKSITPPERWYGVYNVEEPASLIIAETYKALGIPKNHIYPLSLKNTNWKKAHVYGVKNVANKKIWIKMLGKGN